MQSLAIVFVGDSLAREGDFEDYVTRLVRASCGAPSHLLRFGDNDKNLYAALEYLVKNLDQILLLASPESFLTVLKLLATLGGEELAWQGDEPLPPRLARREGESYLMQFERARLNLLQVSAFGTLAPILLEGGEGEFSLYLMGLESDSALLLLSPLAESHHLALKALNDRLIVQPLKFADSESFLVGVRALFGEKIVPASSIPQRVVERLKARGRVVSTAESCTGGEVAQLLTQIPGASEVFHGGIVAYDNAIKERWLGVDRGNLELYGAVSEAVVKDMLQGTLKASGADYAIAISGVAGPGGGSAHKPVGTVFIGVASTQGSEVVERLLFKGDRRYIQRQAALHALYLLLRLMIDEG